MNPVVIKLQLAAAQSGGYAAAQQPAAAGALLLNGALVTNGVGQADVARRVVAASANAGDTTQTITVTGTDRYSNSISEALLLNGTTPVFTTQDFLTVTKATISAATAGNVTLGTNGTASTQWVCTDFQLTPINIGMAVVVSSVNTPTYTVEHTYDDPNNNQAANQNASISPQSVFPPIPWADPALAGRNTSGETSTNVPSFAQRMTITAGTGAATFYLIQAGVI